MAKLTYQIALTHPEILGDPSIAAGVIEKQRLMDACLRDPTCRAEYIRGQQPQFFDYGGDFTTALQIASAAIASLATGAGIVGLPVALTSTAITTAGQIATTIEPEWRPIVAPLTRAARLGGGIVNGFGDIFSDIGGLFTGEATFGDVFADVGSILSPLAPALISTFAARPSPQAMMGGDIFQQGRQLIQGGVRMLSGPTGMGTAAGTAIVLASRFAQRYPFLAEALRLSKEAGHAITRSRAWSLLRQYGPSILVSFGTWWTADAIRDLMLAGPGRRRMNPANTKALRRSLRRLESFDRLACRVSSQLGAVARRSPRRRKGRCRVCRSSPCRCA